MFPRQLGIHQFIGFICAAATVAWVPGCGGGNDLPGSSGTVSGNASYLGKPIPEGSALVMVHNVEGLFGIGITDRQGDFTIKMRERPDVLVGEYTVNIKPPGAYN